MQFTVDRDILSEAVSWAARALSPRPPAPVLSGLLITAESQQVTISSFDYEVSAQLQIDADVSDQGTVLVSGRLLNDIVKSLPNAPVTLSLEENKVVVVCRSSTFTLTTMPVDEYPDLPAQPHVAGVVDGSEFSRAVSQVISAAARDDTLPLLTAVKLEIEGETITFFATDRYRLAMREITWRPADPSISTSLQIKAKTLNEVAKSLAGSGDLSIAISDDDALVGFSSGGRRTTSTLVDGDYPKIRQLFPEETPIHAVVNTAELIEAARRVSLVAERNGHVRLQFAENNQVTLDAGVDDNASASEVVAAQLSGEPITVGFNPAYLNEGLGVFDTEYLRFSFVSAPKPAMITGQPEAEGENSTDFRYLLMPVRLISQ
ncbi:DNA polymerase III subunit beta [Nesterenkonia alkaliphila]|uniref:Beta sliding clamp n=1 Tax=Nesterenkonia alkaliphila TaxID=1463631 RepID=A0A7K1UG85_9MICC|nr:DNA polymerase III subunit beta [Nesterenkonia alkaliphila]MVT25414.1 DNA polymerase III subunit beta [Nesterenkonia alkaliphila]GFZ83287.1 DNA polymerase III subunit beta [Nesterenkonia alkaliphila]